MIKFRIVQLFHDAYSSERNVEWVIEQKKVMADILIKCESDILNS